MNNGILIIYGSLNSVPSPEGAAPAKIIEETVNHLNNSKFKVLSNTNVKLEKIEYEKNIFQHVNYNWVTRLLFKSLRIRYPYEKRKELFITASPQQLEYFIAVCLYVRKHAYKKVIVHVSPGLVQMLSMFCSKVEIVFYHHGTSLHTKLSENQWVRLLKHTKAIFGVNKTAKIDANRVFKNKISNTKYYSIYNGVKSMVLKSSNKSKKFTLMYSGRVCKEKGVMFLLKALKLLINKGLEVELIIAGASGTKRGIKQANIYLEKCRDFIDENNLPVTFTGFLNQDELKKIYNKVHILILPTDPTLSSEGLSLALIEGMSVGLPLIATNVGGNSELIENDKNGFLLNKTKNYEGEIASNVEDLFLNKEKYDLFSVNSKYKYNREFTVDKMSSNFFNSLKLIHFVQ